MHTRLRSIAGLAAPALVLAVVVSPSPAGAQVPERDRLLNCFYDARTSRPEEARSCLTKLLEAQPKDVQALLELGFFEVAQHREAEAIDAFNRAVQAGSTRADVRAQLGYLYLARHDRERALESFDAALALDPSNEKVRMQSAYLLDEMGRKRDAKQRFDQIEKQTTDDALRRQACGASEMLAPVARRGLPHPYFVDVYTAPDWYSNIDVATLPLRVRSGAALASGRVELFGQAAMLADNRSDASAQPGPVIYFDNVLVLGGGASVQPFSGVGLTLSVELGTAYDLVDQNRDPWRFDARVGAQYYGAWNVASRCPPNVTFPFRPVLELYATSFYFSRYEDLISTVRARPGLRVLETARTSLDANLHVAGIVDSEGLDYNNLFEIGGGAIFTPDRRLGVRIGFETVRRQFQGGTHDVVTRIRIEYGARF